MPAIRSSTERHDRDHLWLFHPYRHENTYLERDSYSRPFWLFCKADHWDVENWSKIRQVHVGVWEDRPTTSTPSMPHVDSRDTTMPQVHMSSQQTHHMAAQVPQPLMSRVDHIARDVTHIREMVEDQQQHNMSQFSCLYDNLLRLAKERQTYVRSRGGPPPIGGKDSTGNYTRRCVRDHVATAFGFSRSKQLPEPPTEQYKTTILENINNSRMLSKPFRYDWNSPPNDPYNLCIEEAFFADFWTAVRDGVYQVKHIPSIYQTREGFTTLFRRHLEHLKRKRHQATLPEDTIKRLGSRAAKNSRKGTTYRNRLGAAIHVGPPDLAQRVLNLVRAMGTRGISSDIARPTQSNRKKYIVCDNPWRSPAATRLFRYLDHLHIQTRNPNGNPPRERIHGYRSRRNPEVPSGLPADCYDPSYLRHIPRVKRQLLRPKPPIGVDDLWWEVDQCRTKGAHGSVPL